jgi:hypothetical protein
VLTIRRQVIQNVQFLLWDWLFNATSSNHTRKQKNSAHTYTLNNIQNYMNLGRRIS